MAAQGEAVVTGAQIATAQNAAAASGRGQFAGWIREQLRARNWSQADLYRVAGVSRSWTSRACNGEVGENVDSVLRVLAAFGIEIASAAPPPARPRRVYPHALACSVPDCERKAFARGWCAAHYGRWHRDGDVRAGEPIGAYAKRKGKR